VGYPPLAAPSPGASPQQPSPPGAGLAAVPLPGCLLIRRALPTSAHDAPRSRAFATAVPVNSSTRSAILDSLESTEGVDRSKVVDVVVEILTGLADQLDGRDTHPLRDSVGGNSRPVVRADGAICWRAALQRETASARRLHFWRLGQTVELSRVGLHDDVSP